MIEITGTDVDGDTIARPAAWEESGPPPLIYVAPEKRSRSAFAAGERALARLSPIGPATYEARIIRRLLAAPPRALGLYTLVDGRGRILPVDKRAREELVVAPGEEGGAEPGDLVWAEVRTARPLGLKQARIVERLGPSMGARSISLITLHDHDLPAKFSEAALTEAGAARAASLDDRDDLRAVPLVTIDGEDARDFDDAVFAEPDCDKDNAGGWHLLVAIADVAWYVRPGSALDRAAFERGNSVYFPDRVAADAAAPTLERLVFARSRRGPPVPCRAPVDRCRGPAAAPSLRPRFDALGRPADLPPGRSGAARNGR